MDHHEENEKRGRPGSFSEAYKREAVAQAASGNISQTARALGISNKSLHSWIKTYGCPSSEPFGHIGQKTNRHFGA